MKRIYIFIFLTAFCCSLFAQSAQRADELFNAAQYDEAAVQYEGLLQKAPKNQLYLYRYARCMQELGNTQEAIHYFELAGEKYTLRNFYLGALYVDNYQFAQALTCLEAYLGKITDENERYETTVALIEKAKKGEKYIRRVEDITILDSVVLSKADFLKAYQLSAEAGQLQYDEGAVTYINQRQDRKYMATGDQVLQLQACHRLLDEWADCDPIVLFPQQMTNYPYLMSDGVTLYFAAITPDGLGGYDIYQTKYNSATDTWLTPENIGMPFNSFANDYMYVIDEQQQIGYFATDRRCSEDSVCVYSFRPNQEKRILKNVDEATIRLRAQLLEAATTTTQQPIQPATTATTITQPTKATTSTAQTADFFFPVYGAIAYTSFGEFQSSDARTLFQQWLSQDKKRKEMESTLREKRLQYANADANTQKAMKTEILALENQLVEAEKQSKQTLNRIRKMEQQARK